MSWLTRVNRLRGIDEHMPQPIVYLISAAGYPNLGDEWIAHIRIQRHLKMNPTVLVYLDCQNPDMFLCLFPEYHQEPRVRVVSTSWRWLSELQPKGVWQGLRDIERAVISNSQDSPGSLLWMTQLRQGNFLPKKIEVLGGGFVNDLWPINGLLLEMASRMKQEYNATLHWLQCSAFPLSSALLFDLTPALSTFDFISTRDAASHERLSTIYPDVELEDDAVLNDLTSPNPILRLPSPTEGTPHLYLNLGRDVFSVEEFSSAFERLLKAARPLASSHRLIYLLANPVADHTAYERLKSVFNQIEVWDLPKLIRLTCTDNEQWRLPARSTAIVSRFHLRIFLSNAGLIGKLIKAGAYYDNKHSSLDRYAELQSWQAI